MRKSTIASLLVLLVLIPATLYLGSQMKGRWYYLTCTLVVIEAMLPFFCAFEARRPQARELVTLAVMAALAVAGRVVIPIPYFKAIMGIIMITGIAFGPQAGFMTGAIAVFASNFFYSQGPWTPWQMLAYGMAGFWAGLVFHGRRWKIQESAWGYPVVLAVFGFVSLVVFIGPLLDLCTVFTTGSRITLHFVLAVFASGFPVNITHGLGTAVTLLLFSRPLLKKLNRLQVKYGMMEAHGDDGQT